MKIAEIIVKVFFSLYYKVSNGQHIIIKIDIFLKSNNCKMISKKIKFKIKKTISIFNKIEIFKD